MKQYLDYIPSFLLSISLIYFGIAGFSVAASIVVGFLCASFCYQQYLFRTAQPDVNKELKEELDKIKLYYDKKFTDMEDEVSKVALSASRLPTLQSKRETPKINF